MSAVAEEQEGGKMPLLDHLVELRSRLLKSVVGLVIAFLGCFFFAEQIFEFLQRPLAEALIASGEDGRLLRIIFTHPAEVFITYIKMAFFAGAFIACPVFLTQIWMFVAPGLYKTEKSAFLPFLIATPVLFLTGGGLVYYVIYPVALNFFLGFETAGGANALPIELETKISEYFSLLMKLIFAFGLCFQLPVIMTLMARVGMATSKGMAAKRKYAIVGVFVVAAIFTPPDPLSQLLLAIPIVILYEVSIIMARLVEKKRPKDEYDDDDDDLGTQVTEN